MEWRRSNRVATAAMRAPHILFAGLSIIAMFVLDLHVTSAQKVLVLERGTDTEGMSTEQLADYVEEMGCTMPEYADYAQCSCNENGCCYSQQPTWWVKWSICESSCCFKLGTVALATAVVLPVLLVLGLVSLCMCCYFNKCCKPFSCCNFQRLKAGGMDGSGNHSGVMFIPNTTFEDYGPDVAASVNLDDLFNLGADNQGGKETPRLQYSVVSNAYVPPKQEAMLMRVDR
jgi:hypothetical protein